MKRIILAFGRVFCLLPSLAFAQASACSPTGYTVLYTNGVLYTEDQARADAKDLWNYLGSQYNNQPLTVQLDYNTSHIDGALDVAQTIAQMAFSSLSNLNLHTMLRQAAVEDTTQKLLIVGHSQGALYANQMYSYITQNGEPASSVGVYAVATPATYVAGGGSYVTSSSDALLYLVAEGAKAGGLPAPLPPNVDTFSDPALGSGIKATHAFVGAYLYSAGDRIAADIDQALGQLKSNPTAGAAGNCFTPPAITQSDLDEEKALSIADPVANAIVKGDNDAVLALDKVSDAATALVVGAINTILALQHAQTTAVTQTAQNLTNASSTEKNFTIVKTLYGSSLDQSDVKDLLGTGQGGAVILTIKDTTEVPVPTNGGVVLGTSTIAATTTAVTSTSTKPYIDPNFYNWRPGGGGGGFTDPVPSTDTPAPTLLFDASTTAPVLSVAECAASLSPDFCLIPTTQATVSWSAPAGAAQYAVFVNGTQVKTTTGTSTTLTLGDQATSTISVTAFDASSTPATSDTQAVYVFTQPLVINEIEWAGDKIDPAREWIELRNRTPYDLDLSNINISAQEGGAQYIPLSGSIKAATWDYVNYGPLIALGQASGFWTVERIDGAPAGATPWVMVNEFDQLADSGEQLALMWQGGGATTTLDETPPTSACNGWCAGASVDSSGINATLSMERVDATTSGMLASNWASNDTYDGVANMPGGQGQSLYATLMQDNSYHLPSFGFFCTPETASITAGASYAPQAGPCYVLTSYIPYPGPVSVGLFKGTVGTSTLVALDSERWPSGTYDTLRNIDWGGAHQPGDQYFVAAWSDGLVDGFLFGDASNPTDDTNIISYLTSGVWAGSPGFINSSGEPFVLKTLPFTYGQ